MEVDQNYLLNLDAHRGYTYDNRKYDKITNLGFLLIKLLFLCYISYYLWFLTEDNIIYLMIPFVKKTILNRDNKPYLVHNTRFFKATTPVQISTIRYVSPKYQSLLEPKTPAYKRKHAIIVDDTNLNKTGKYELQAVLTSGTGGKPPYRSKIINNTSNFKKQPRPQKLSFLNQKRISQYHHHS